jgi:hypothetical protein
MPATHVNGNTYTVEISFPATASFGDVLTLDDPVKGLLESATYLLGGDIWADITDYVTDVSVSRGRSRQLDAFNAGTASITLRNESRLFDPSNTAGTYFGGIVPRRPVRITVNGAQIFNGYVDDYGLQWTTDTTGTTTVTCSDGFTLLAATALDAFTPSTEGSGARVATVLDRPEIAYPAGSRAIDTGSGTLGAYPVDAGTTALDYLQAVAVAEQGYLFVARDGVLTFRGRADVLNRTGTIVFSDTGAPGTVPYRGYSVQYGTELLYNRVVTSRVGGGEQVATDTGSQAAYLTSTLTRTGLLVDTDQAAVDIGTFLLGKYAEPELRIDEIDVTIADDSATFAQLMLVEVGDVVTVTRTYGTGSPSTVTQKVSVESIAHQIGTGEHRVRFRFGSVDSRTFLELDDATFGTLDANLLAF